METVLVIQSVPFLYISYVNFCLSAVLSVLKKYRLHALALLFILPCRLYAQEFVYVNTDNLIMRDRPEKIYNVFAILHAPSKLKIEPYEDAYINNEAVKRTFYMVSISYRDNRRIYHYVRGWVEKRYVITDKSKISAGGVDTVLDLDESEVASAPNKGFDYVQDGSQGSFLPPKYRGGEKPAATLTRMYHKGPRGGCYYVNQKKKKVYVDKHFCNGK